MANRMYDWGRQRFADGHIAWSTDTIRVVGVMGAYTPDTTLAGQHHLADILSSMRSGGPTTLTGKTNIGGALMADNAILPAVPVSAAIVYLVLYKDDGSANEANFDLIGIIDNANGLPTTPTGTNLIIAWDTSTGYLLKL